MDASDTTPAEGEKVEEQSDELLGLFHGTTAEDLELEVTPKRTDGFVQLDLHGPPNLTLLLTSERTKRIITVLSMAVEDLDEESRAGADYSNGP